MVTMGTAPIKVTHSFIHTYWGFFFSPGRKFGSLFYKKANCDRGVLHGLVNESPTFVELSTQFSQDNSLSVVEGPGACSPRDLRFFTFCHSLATTLRLRTKGTRERGSLLLQPGFELTTCPESSSTSLMQCSCHYIYINFIS